MRAADRRQQILTRLQELGRVDVTGLAEELGVSQNTIRKDLVALADQGLATRTHGGATAARSVLPLSLYPRADAHSPSAGCIVKYAASWITDGDSLILDSSPLCVLLAQRMHHLRYLRVITTSLPIAYLLAQEPTNTVVVAGGEFDFGTLATRGSLAQAAIQDFRADKAFLSCTGVSPQGGLTEVSTGSAQTKRRIKEAAGSAFVLIESARVGKSDLFPVGGLAEVRRIVTDDGLDLGDVDALLEKGAKVTICDPDGHKTYRPKPSAQGKLRIGFANLADGIWFSRDVREGIQRAAQQMEHIEVLVTDNRNSAEAAIQNAEELLKQDIDLLVEYDGTGVAGRSVLRMMQLADVPVIAVDIPFMGATYFGCNHDAIGITAGQALGRWIRDRWQGKLDEIMLVTCAGGGDKRGSETIRVEDWTGGALPSSLAPAMRLDAALDALQTIIPPTLRVRRLVAPGDWPTSAEAVSVFTDLFVETLASIPRDRRVAAVCLLNELALGLAQAVRGAQREDRFVVVSFGSRDAATHAELSLPNTCLLGIVDLNPEGYGKGLLETCLRIVNGEAVPPAVFVEHRFLSSAQVQGGVKEVPMK